jgi:4-amino-4-deoxy-L-arabinose transferase-like glycosyltransferase
VDRERRAPLLLTAVLLLALAPRAYFAAVLSEDEFFVFDGFEYKDIAANLVNGDGYSISFYRWFEPVDPAVEPLGMEFERPELARHRRVFRPPVALRPDFSRPPLLPLLGAAALSLPGGWELWSRSMAVALGLAAILGVYWVGRLAFNRMTGLIAAALFAFYPYAVYYSAHWLTELLATPLLLACVGLALVSRRDGFRTRHLLLLGAVGGLAVTARPNLLPSIVGLVAWVAVVSPSWRGRVRSAAICGVGLVLLLAPWTIRNYSHLKVIQPLTFHGPYNLWLGMNEYAYNATSSRSTGTGFKKRGTSSPGIQTRPRT